MKLNLAGYQAEDDGVAEIMRGAGMNALTAPCLEIILFMLQMFGAAILALLGNRWLQRIRSQEERHSRQFEEDMAWLERYLSAMSLSLDAVEAMRIPHSAAWPLRIEAAKVLRQITPESDARLVRIRNLNDEMLNRLLDQFCEQSREFGIENPQLSLEQLAASATDDLLTGMKLTLQVAKLGAGELRSQGSPR